MKEEMMDFSMARFKCALALMAFSALSTAVMAQTTIDVSGEVIADVCDVRINGVSTATVRLPKISLSQIPVEGDSAGDTNLDVALTNCDIGMVSEVQMHFSSPAASVITGRIDSGVSGISLQIRSRPNDRQIFVEQSSSTQIVYNVYSERVNAAGEANLDYAVRYFREAGVPGQGQVNALINLTVAYQ